MERDVQKLPTVSNWKYKELPEDEALCFSACLSIDWILNSSDFLFREFKSNLPPWKMHLLVFSPVWITTKVCDVLTNIAYPSSDICHHVTNRALWKIPALSHAPYTEVKDHCMITFKDCKTSAKWYKKQSSISWKQQEGMLLWTI